MESHTGRESCENCVLCAASNRAHSLKLSGQAFLDRVRQKVNPAVANVVQVISEGSRRFEEAHPKTSEILGRAGRKILSVGVVVLEKSKTVYHKGVSGAKNAHIYTSNPSRSSPSAHQRKNFFIENGISCYFCGGLLLIAGTYLITIPLAVASTPSLVPCYVWYIIVVNALVLVPVAYWWLHKRLLTEVDDDSSSQTEITDKPPVYESLPPAFSPLPPTSLGDVAPPKYEELFDGSQPLLHDSDRQLVGVPLCDVHQPHETPPTSDNQNETDTTATSPKSHRLSRSSSSNV